MGLKAAEKGKRLIASLEEYKLVNLDELVMIDEMKKIIGQGSKDADAMNRFLAGASRDQVQVVYMLGGRSVAYDSARGVPSKEIAAMHQALEKLSKLGKEEKTEPDASKVVTGLKLPDPEKRPELYRLYSSGFWGHLFKKPKLALIWGIYKESGDMLPAQAAIEKLKKSKPFPGYLVLNWLLLVLFVLLVPLLLFVLISAYIPLAHKKALPHSGAAQSHAHPTPIANAGIGQGPRQYFQLKPLRIAIGHAAVATAAAPGIVRDGVEAPMPISPQAPTKLTGFLKPGRYRVDWQPDGNGLHGEFIYVEASNIIGHDGKPRTPFPFRNDKPVANVFLSPREAHVGETVTANTAHSYAAAGSKIVKREIRWAKGEPYQTISGSYASHVFKKRGVYDVGVKVIDSDNRVGNADAYVGVGEPAPTPRRVALIKIRSFRIIEVGHRPENGNEEVTLVVQDKYRPNYRHFQVRGWGVLPAKATSDRHHDQYTVTIPPGLYTVQVRISYGPKNSRIVHTYQCQLKTKLNIKSSAKIGKTTLVKSP